MQLLFIYAYKVKTNLTHHKKFLILTKTSTKIQIKLMLKSQLTDDELWKAVALNDARALTVLYNRYWKKLYKTAEYYLKDSDIAEQVVHDVFVVLWKRRAYLNIKNFANYIHITARYHVFKQLKAKKLSPIEYIESYEDLETENSYNKAEAKLNYRDFENRLAECLEPLPKRCREIFWLSRIENLSNEEIAEKFGISKRTVENQITAALRHIRSSLQENPAIAFSVLFAILWR